jgi:hypothetical protein
MNKLTIILPIHEFSESIIKYLEIAIGSVLKQKDAVVPNIVIVYSHKAEEGGLLNFVNSNDFLLKYSIVKLLKNEGKTDFCSQVNFGVQNIDTDYFSILEFDDAYAETYFKNVYKHIEALPDVALFLPITIDVDDKTNNPLQMVNQNIWSNGYVGENGTLGYLNVRSLNEFSFYTLGGCVINRNEFLAVGGLKSNIVLAFTYEFILRFLNNGNKIFTIPKFGYKHIINRDGSLFMGLGATLTNEDRSFWFQTANKESHFFTDREIERTKIVYENQIVSE